MKTLLRIEAENINSKSIILLPKDKTFGQIQNSQNVTLNNIRLGDNIDTFLKVQGTRSKAFRLSNTDIKNVKFAKPSVGDLRWKAPQPLDNWTVVKETKKFGL